MNRNRSRGAAILFALVAMFAASMSQAAIVAAGSVPFTEPSGFYSGVKSFTVYTHDDPANPMPGAPGELTYVYTINNDAGSFLGIVGFNLDAPIGSVVSAGSIPDADVNTAPPSGVINNNDGVVRWDWLPASGIIAPGKAGDDLFIISSFTPGTVNDTIFSLEGDFGFDVQSTCVGPFDPPVVACTLDILKEGCVVQPDPPPGDACDGKVKCFEFQYTGLGCDASSNLQDPKKTLCLGGANGTQPVDILVGGKKHKKKKGWWGWWNKKKSKKKFASFEDVQIGDVNEVCAGHGGKHNLGSKTSVAIKVGEGYPEDQEHHHHEVIEFDKFHTSCSQPFGPGMQFGSLLITSVTSTRGGTVTLPEDPPEEECVTEIDVSEPPHCVGKVTQLVLRYVGGDCSGSINSQDPTKVSCFDASPAGTYPVRVIVSDGASAPPSSTAYTDVEPVAIGDLVTVNASAAGHANLSSTTGYWIKDAGDDTLRGDGFFHTSCSQPLNLGDQFGPLQVFAITSTQGGTVSLEHEVTYSYEVTNPNAGVATNVSVDDDQIGNIATGQTIAAGATATFTATAFISQQTTNVATVTGVVDSAVCDPASASATITVVEPPPPGAICTTKVQAMSLRYEGPNILAARVEIEAKTFPLDLVVYDPIDLIGSVTELSLASENGFSIDATTHNAIDLGSRTTIRINGVAEVLHTSCSTPFESGKPAPLNMPKGDPSPNWTVVDFTQKE